MLEKIIPVKFYLNLENDIFSFILYILGLIKIGRLMRPSLRYGSSVNSEGPIQA